ncbi:MAG: D-3-phosphoglycerate dehydrogenase / 2-oxoglutarate reductase [Frankiaceae bacterium]|nr:D-3-phosphoglycerate dehydrogenase / 2-oxoglutarate reductase [Frankiaceae bacterium]MDQ1649530.1 D-3-phosphoglycerate dehydrogenase / 2-oxoglutarate reductase [Frankiaceae bacterium]MDQ1671678.1 D-3-phosphoglycerate dehydrogenase / 2-oxoglutarate reductase [Frankiaceae bacterium]
MRAVLLEAIHPIAAQLLTDAGFEVEVWDRAASEDELVKLLADTELVGIRSGTQITERALAEAENLLAIGAFCIGTNQIDLDAAASRGVAVFNAPFSNTRSVVELALSEIIALTRRLTVKNDLMHSGTWDKSASGSHEVRGRRLGIVGYGNIGTQLSVLAENLGMTVAFYDSADKLALGNAQRCSTLDELLATSDVVTLHVDGRPGNRGFFGDKEFALMKPGAMFLNLSRGFVVDQEALRDHLLSGHLAGAALDVFSSEPAGRGDPFESPLRGIPNVILTPHVGGSTEEAQADIGQFVARKLLAFAGGGNTSLAVNMPPVHPTASEAAHRLIHIHRNTPGVLATINRLMAEEGLNIEAQHLGTRGEVGFVVTDVAANFSDAILERLRALPETLRLRVLTSE